MKIKHDRKVMFVVPSLEGGGAERVAVNLIKEFCAMGINVTLVLFSKKISYDLPEKTVVKYLPIYDNRNILYTVIKFFQAIFYLRRVIKEEKPFNILSFMDYTNVIAILSNLISPKKTKLTLSVHISPTLHIHKYNKNIWNKFISVFIRFLYNRADRIISVSEFIREDLIANFNIDKSKVVTIYNPVDINRIENLSREELSHPWFNDSIPVILSAGRLTKQKGFDFLLRAFSILRKEINARLVILGEGEDELYLKNLSNRLGIDVSVDFLGFKENPYKYMKRATIYVMSSLYEGFPMVLLEAMACGVPVISTIYNPGFSEIVENEKNGLLVPVANEKALADAMLRLLNNP